MRILVSAAALGLVVTLGACSPAAEAPAPTPAAEPAAPAPAAEAPAATPAPAAEAPAPAAPVEVGAQTIALATGNAQRFISVYDQYKANPDVTSRRLYLETMERVLRSMNKVLVDNSAGSGTIPYLPLDKLIQSQQPATAPVRRSPCS